MRAVICLTTVATLRQAKRLAETLVKKKLAACVQVTPLSLSVYRWKGKICRDREFLLIVKTMAPAARKIEKMLGKEHPYELPEWVVLPLSGGSARYLKWISSSVGG